MGTTPLGGKVGRDQKVNARTFMLDSLALAGKHWGAAMRDTNPVGALPTTFVPAGAHPFGDLDRHGEARKTTISLASSLPSVAAALGIATGIAPPGVTSEAGPARLAGGGTSGEAEAEKAKREGEASAAERAKAKRERERTKEKERRKRLTAEADKTEATVSNGVLTYGAGADARSASIAELAAAAGVGVNDLCWPVVAARGNPQIRFKFCPCNQRAGHKTANDAMHKRPEGFGDKLSSIFGGQRNSA